ncbi:MAG: two-component regulator propeller domain-containing protein, partial [Candidatus Hinthialibacter sp.]
NCIYAIFQDSQKRMWIGTEGGASLYDGEKFVNITNKEGLSANEVFSITEDDAGTIWFGTIWGLTSYDGRKFCIYTVQEGLVNNEVHALYRDDHGVLWIGTKQGVSCYDGKSFSNLTAADGLSNSFVYSIEEDIEGRLWFAADSGVSHYDGRGFITFSVKDGLAHNRMSAVHRDDHGVLWFATQRSGISRYDDHTLVNYTVRDGLTHNTVWAIAGDVDGKMWIGTGDGLARFDGRTFTHFGGRNGFPKDKITCIYRTSDEALWIGTWTKGLFRYDGKSITEFNRTNGLATDRVSVICTGNDGMLWIGHSAGGISRLDLETLTVQSVIYPPGLNNIHTRSIYPASGGLTWIGMTEWGLWRYEEGRFINFSVQDGLLNNHVEAIHPGLDGTLWLATEEGVSRFDGERFFDLTKKEGLADNKINIMMRDRQGRLWLGAQSAGVMVYDETMWSTLDVRDGLASNTVYAIYEDEKGFLWIGAEQGLSRYHPRSSSPTVNILSLQGDRKYTDLSMAPSLIAGARLSIDYEAIDLKTISAKHQYYVRILKENQTIFSGPTNSAVFNWTPTTPGLYTFEVQAVDRDLQVSLPAQVAFRIYPPWYLNAKIIFPAMIGLLGWIGAMVLLGFHMITNRRKARQLYIQLLDNERERNVLLQESKEAAETASKTKSIFLANMSHDIRTPLNAILGYAQILLRKNNLPVEARSALLTIVDSGNHLLSLITDILDLSKVEAGCSELNLTNFDLIRCIEDMSSIFGFRCAEKGLVWRVEWNLAPWHDGTAWDGESCPSIPKQRIVHADKSKLCKILTNLLSNAVKFTDAGDVILRITESPSKRQDGASHPLEASLYTFEVIDTGIGVPAADHEHIFGAFAQETHGKLRGGVGLGLAIAKQYVEIMGGRIGVESTPGEGSRFAFELQLMSGTMESGVDAGEFYRSGRSQIVRLAKGFHIRALVVDDFQENRKVLAQFLRDVGVDVIEAEDGKQALEAVEEFSLDIVFMDVRMPVMDGLTAAKHIRQISDKSTPKLVAVSASALKHERQNYLESGFEEFMAKPIAAESVYDVLARLLSVRFESGPCDAGAGSIEDVTIPAELLSRLRSAAELYNTTKLKHLLNQVETLGEDGRKFAEHLRHWIERSELEAVIRVLEQIEGHES